MWIPGRWALSAFQVALFALAGFLIIKRRGRIGWHPIAVLLLLAALWGVLQIALHQTIYEWRTRDAVLSWITNLTAFSVAACLAGSRTSRERFLNATLIFALVLSFIAILTVLTSPPDKVFWRFDAGTTSPTLGPFVYRNQFAAFVEAVLPLAILRAISDRRRSALYIAIAAALFASVVAGGSRAGSFLCLAEILITPLIAYAQHRISAGTVARVAAVTIAAIGVSVAISGWQTIWNRLQEANPYSL